MTDQKSIEIEGKELLVSEGTKDGEKVAAIGITTGSNPEYLHYKLLTKETSTNLIELLTEIHNLEKSDE